MLRPGVLVSKRQDATPVQASLRVFVLIICCCGAVVQEEIVVAGGSVAEPLPERPH